MKGEEEREGALCEVRDAYRRALRSADKDSTKGSCSGPLLSRKTFFQVTAFYCLPSGQTHVPTRHTPQPKGATFCDS